MRAKVEHEHKPQKELRERASVGLSYSPNLTASRIHVQRFNTGETIVRATNNPKALHFHQPPTNEGQRVQRKGLSRKAKTRIRRAAALYQHMADEGKSRRSFVSFITLSYGEDIPSHETSKKDLDIFFKRLRRKVGHAFHYVWVAELQERGAIHYHILTPEFIQKQWINDNWTEVVCSRLHKEGKPPQKLFPNVKGKKAYNAKKYMTKYMSKNGDNIIGNGYFISHETSKQLKPTYEETYDIHIDDVDEVLGGIEASSKKDAYLIATETEDRTGRFMWISETNDYLFREAIEYSLYGHEASLNTEKKKRHHEYSD